MVGNLGTVIVTATVGTGGTLGFPQYGIYDIFQSSTYIQNPGTDWKNLSYEYSGCALGLYVDGHVETITREKGTSAQFETAISKHVTTTLTAWKADVLE